MTLGIQKAIEGRVQNSTSHPDTTGKNPTAPLSQKTKRIWQVAGLVFFCVLIDQGSKIAAQRHLMVWSHETDKAMYQGSRKQLILVGNDMPTTTNLQSFVRVSLNYVRNPGAAWGTFAQMPTRIRVPFFFALTAVAIGVIIYFLKITPWSNALARSGLYLILSGALGNFIDRARLGFVIDWLDIRWRVHSWPYNFPAFNAADVYISVGVALLVFDLIVREPRRQKAAAESGGGPGVVPGG